MVTPCVVFGYGAMWLGRRGGLVGGAWQLGLARRSACRACVCPPRPPPQPRLRIGLREGGVSELCFPATGPLVIAPKHKPLSARLVEETLAQRKVKVAARAERREKRESEAREKTKPA